MSYMRTRYQSQFMSFGGEKISGLGRDEKRSRMSLIRAGKLGNI